MKKIILVFSIFVLILITSLVKNSTKKIEDNIFTINENVRLLRAEFGDIMLEYDFLSSPEKLMDIISRKPSVMIGKTFFNIPNKMTQYV